MSEQMPHVGWCQAAPWFEERNEFGAHECIVCAAWVAGVAWILDQLPPSPETAKFDALRTMLAAVRGAGGVVASDLALNPPAFDLGPVPAAAPQAGDPETDEKASV